jgi:hypothetical protein
MKFVHSAEEDGLLVRHLGDNIRRVLIVFLHGLGDVVMFLGPLQTLRVRYPHIHFDLGLSDQLDQNKIFPTAILLNQEWREQVTAMAYDLVFVCRFPMEDPRRRFATKTEICCEKELGIFSDTDHPPLSAKQLVAVHFHSTAVPDLANAPERVASAIWQDILKAGFVPIETHFEHIFHNPLNQRFDFAQQHVRDWPARVETLMALIGSCAAFVGVASGNFHLALSILGASRVMFLERQVKVTQLTRHAVAAVDLDRYDGQVGRWLEARPWTAEQRIRRLGREE